MRIGIIEIHYHAELLSTLVNIFSEFEVDVYTTKKVYNDIDKNIRYKAKYNIKKTKEKNTDFIDNIETQNYDLFFVNTIQESYLNGKTWINFKPKCKSILFLHNLNAWYNKKFIINKNILHSIDSYLFSKQTKNILNNYQQLAVTYRPLIPQAKKRLKRNMIFIPFSLAKENINHIDKDTVDFVIPGTVDNRRRNYNPVIKALKNIIYNYRNIRLILLGELKNHQHLKNHKNIITFDTYVPRNTYEHYLTHADFIITPSVYQTHTVNTATEYYSVTKSPNIHEAIKHRKPVIVPEYFQLDETMISSSIKYTSSQDLIQQIKHFLDNPDKIKEIKKQAQINMEGFTKCNIQKALMKQLHLR